VTDPNFFSQNTENSENTADFHYRGLLFFSSSTHTPNLFSQNSENSQNTADFHYRGLFFSVARHTPLTFFHKILRIFTTEASLFSVARLPRHTPLTFFHKILRIFTTEASFFE
jgi:hypothetical protein